MTTTAAIKFQCRSCERRIRVPVSYAGKKGRCPYCKASQILPDAGSGSSSSRLGRPRESSRGSSSDERRVSVIDKVETIAAMAGIKLLPSSSPTTRTVLFGLPRGRRQAVHIVSLGEAADGKGIISLMSPALEVKTGFLQGVSKSLAIDLLRRNGGLVFGKFSLTKFEDAELVMFSSNHIIDSLSVEEFVALLNLVAVTADEFEREHGQDRF